MKNILLLLALIAPSVFAAAGTGIRQNGLIEIGSSVTTSVSTTVLFPTSNPNLYLTGTTTHTVRMPDARASELQKKFFISNRSTGAVTVRDASGSSIKSLAAGEKATFRLLTQTTAAGTWDVASSTASGGGVTSVAMTVPSILAVSGSPVTSSGTLAVTLNTVPRSTGGAIFLNAPICPPPGPCSPATQVPTFTPVAPNIFGNIPPHNVIIGPTSGFPGQSSARALVDSDISTVGISATLKTLNAASGSTINWGTDILNDLSNVLSQNWDARTLYDQSGSSTLYYGNGIQINGTAGSRAMVTDSANRVTTSSVTDVELGYLSGVTSPIQAQLNALAGGGGSIDLTSITTSVIPATSATKDLGDPTHLFRDAYVQSIKNAAGVELFNASGVTLSDNSGIESVDAETRRIFDASDVRSIDYGNRRLTQSNVSGGIRVDWSSGVDTLFDDSHSESIKWGSREALNGSGTTIIDWENGILNDSAGVDSVDSGTRTLWDSSETQSMSWETRHLNDDGGDTTLNWQLRMAFDADANQSINWGTDTLRDLDGVLSQNWDARKAYDSAGVESADWSKGLRSKAGATGARPGGLGVGDAGVQYFDTDLGKPIWWSGTAWVDATGTGV